ncbi:response regulator [Gemmata sp. JC717]|uniref:hybrid sensor histidine kinase/response regulator n=1 Tax=Gemmata algarum TaxID=2975278 RepID=UPI0021BB9876|nr:response regulator [Gemmata algarum]MDY3554943.1 response regulator [Gemmata algarum]
MPHRILIVEDERIPAADLELRLTALGYEVVGSVATGADALRLAGERAPDLVLMDIRLRGDLDGIDAADRVRAEHFVPVVFLTAHSDDETLTRARVAEPYGYLLKPFQERELRTVIEMALYKHAAERRLRASERRYATTLASIGDGVIATDRAGAVTFLNPVAERLTGWPLAEAAGRSLHDVFVISNEATRLPVENPVDRVLREGRVVGLANHTVLTARTGGECPIDDCAAPILDDRGAVDGAVLVFRDITARRRQEDEKARLDEKLREGTKLEAIGRLAGGVAHDFNNLLTVINGYADLLLAGLTERGPLWEPLAAIQDAGERAARLTQQLLAFSRRSMVEPKVLDLNAVATHIGKLLRRLIGEHITLALALDPYLAPVTADLGQIEQVIINLAVNARDAMPGGGRLTLETRNVELRPADTASQPDLRPGRYVRLAVADTGAGIPEDVRPHIFEPFFTTKGVGKGTGLGLAVVHGVVKQAGGHITVECPHGAGTTFVMLFPACAAPDAPAPAPAPVPTGGTETILLVEDEEPVRNIARIALDVQGYTVLTAGCAADALNVSAAHPGRIDLLVTDVVMPNAGGRELGDALRAARPNVKILFMSGYTDEAVVPDGAFGSGEAFIQKPFSPIGLARKVRAVLDARG